MIVDDYWSGQMSQWHFGEPLRSPDSLYSQKGQTNDSRVIGQNEEGMKKKGKQREEVWVNKMQERNNRRLRETGNGMQGKRERKTQRSKDRN